MEIGIRMNGGEDGRVGERGDGVEPATEPDFIAGRVVWTEADNQQTGSSSMAAFHDRLP